MRLNHMRRSAAFACTADERGRYGFTAGTLFANGVNGADGADGVVRLADARRTPIDGPALCPAWSPPV